MTKTDKNQSPEAKAVRETLDALPGTNERKRGCWICGEASEISITVQARGRDAATHGDNTSQTRSFCREHTVAVWGDLMGALKPGLDDES